MESLLLEICVGCRNNNHVRCDTHRRAGIQMRQKREDQCLLSCAEDEVVEVAFALLHHEAIKIAETPATALAALARQGRGEVHESTLTPQEREESVKAKQKEISSFLKRAAVEAATRSGLQCKSLMRMRWVITRKPDDSLKGFTDPQLGAKPTASPRVSRRGRQLFLTVAGSLRMVFEGDAKRPIYKDQLEIRNYTADRSQNWRKHWDWSIISV